MIPELPGSEQANATSVPLPYFTTQAPELVEQYAKAFEKVWKSMREDGAFIEAGENDNLLVQKVSAEPGTLGVLGFSFLEENADKVKAVSLKGVSPTTASGRTYLIKVCSMGKVSE